MSVSSSREGRDEYAIVFPNHCCRPSEGGGPINASGRVLSYHVYILASRPYGTLYIGITSDLQRRLEEHRLGLGSIFVRQYGVTRLVHVETFDDPESAIQREKRLKKWNRDWKIWLIEENNPQWQDRTPLLT